MPYEFHPSVSPGNPYARAISGLRASGARNLSHVRQLSPLPEDAGRAIDDAVHRVGRSRLNFVSALIDAGLVQPLPNWLRILNLAADYVNDVGEAKRTMEFDVQDENARQDIKRQQIPIYGTWETFTFGARLLEVAEGANWPLQTNHVEQATRNVNYSIEYQGINGLPFNIDGLTAPGILTDPTITYDYTGNESWTLKTGEEIKTEVLAMVAKAIEKNYYGPYGLVLPTAYGNILNDDYKVGASTPTTTIRQRLTELVYENRPLQLITVDIMPTDYTALIQMTPEVIDVVLGDGPTPFTWRDGNGPFAATKAMVLANEIVRVHKNYNGFSGIVVGHTGV